MMQDQTLALMAGLAAIDELEPRPRIRASRYPSFLRKAAGEVNWAVAYVLTEYEHGALGGEPFEKPLVHRIPAFCRAVGAFLFWADALNAEAGLGIDPAGQIRAGYAAERARMEKKEEQNTWQSL